MEITGVVISVAHEGMPGCDILTAVKHRTAGVYLILHNLVPSLLRGHFGTFFIGNARIIIEIVGQCSRHTHLIGA